MKSVFQLIIVIILTSCTNQKAIPELKTTSKIISIEDGNILHKDAWTISPEIKFDEFVPRKFDGTKKVSFISDIDTLTLDVKLNATYDFVILLNNEKALTRINTDTLKEQSIAESNMTEYYRDTRNRNSLVDTIPFTLSKFNRIHVKGKINDSDTLDFLFDTGANAIVLVSKLIGTKVNLTLDGEVENEGAFGTQNISSSSSNKLEIENLNWENVDIISIDYQQPKFDGVLGWVAFKNKIVEINYENNLLLIHQSKETIPKAYVKVESKMIRNIPHIKGELAVNNNKSEGWFSYDTGSDGSFILSQKFASENNLNDAMDVIGTSTSTGSTGAKWKSNNYILPKLHFNKFQLSKVPLLINEEDPVGIESKNILGINLLKRFNAIIDLQKFEIYLKPNSLLNSAY